MKLSPDTIMPVLLAPSKNTHDIPVGMMYVQHTNDPQIRRGIPRVREFNLINIPAPNQSDYIACNAIIFEGAKYENKDVIPSFIADARTAGLKVSVGYIVKMFRWRSQTEVDIFVNDILSIPAIDDVMLGWHVIDEPDPTETSASYVEDVVHKFKIAQGSKPWPFNIIFAGVGSTPGSGQEPNAWWPIVDGDRVYQPDACYLSEYIGAIINAGGTPIISLDYYPYASQHFAFGATPPWRKWRFMYEWFRQNYSQYQLHAVIEGDAQTQVQFPNVVNEISPGHNEGRKKRK